MNRCIKNCNEKMELISKKQLGVTLIELMISLALGLILTATLLSIYINTLQTNTSGLNLTRLNQETIALMNVMSSEIRRAGFDDDVDGDDIFGNNFNKTGSDPTEIMVYNSTDGVQRPSQVVPGTTEITGMTGDCILFAYDQNEDGAFNDVEAKGFRLRNNRIEMRINSGGVGDVDDCTSTSTSQWRVISDINRVRIAPNGLIFSFAESTCHNTAAVLDADDNGTITSPEKTAYLTSSNCYAAVPSSNDETIHKRDVIITINAFDADDTLLEVNMTQNVKVRNNLYYVAP